MKEPRLRAIRATVRKRARAWLAELGLVAFCLLCSPLRGAFSPWSVHAKDTCMAAGGVQRLLELGSANRVLPKTKRKKMYQSFPVTRTLRL